MGAMAGSWRLLRAVVLLEEGPTKAAVNRLLYRAGFGVPATPLSMPAVLSEVVLVRPDVVVVDLALCGIGGVQSLASLVRTAPQAAVLAVVPFETLRRPALAVGAAGAATPLDLRPLIECLDAVRSAAHAGLDCDCCGAGASQETGLAPGPRDETSSPRVFPD